MELLREVIDFQSITNEIISENVGEGKSIKNIYLSGVHMQSEKKNQNGRVYPRQVIEREVKRINESKIKQSRFVGELNHPESLEVNLERVSHLTSVLRMEGNDVYGKSKLLDTPLGLVAKKLVEGGVKLGVSSRGAGTLRESIVQNDFSLVCVDIVSDPSCSDAWVDPLLENKAWVMENGILTEKQYDASLKVLDNIILECKFSLDDKKAAFLKLFQDTLANIGSKTK